MVLISVLPAGPIDWHVLADTPAAYLRGDLYAPSSVPYAWSPLVPWLILPIVPFGYVGWTILHLASLAFLRDATLILVAVLSFGIWADIAYGNTLTFVAVAAVVAARGSRRGALAYLTLCILMPRPLQLPLAAWLVIRDRTLRRPAALILVLHTAFVLASGYGWQWLTTLQSLSPQQGGVDLSWAPTSLFGDWWLLAGIPLGIWLTRLGFVGLAGLAISPYVFAQYFAMLLVDADKLIRRSDRRAGRSEG